jgi:FHA domain
MLIGHRPSAVAAEPAMSDGIGVFAAPAPSRVRKRHKEIRTRRAGIATSMKKLVRLACKDADRRHCVRVVRADDITVSRHHAEFRLEDGQFRIVDAGSLNGTHVNGQPVDSTVLANGDVIQIGKYRLVFLTRPTPG